jgi:MFS family permease
MMSWRREIDRAQWKCLFAAQLGWMLDGMDIMLYAFALSAIRAEFQLSSAQAGGLASLTLVASAFGGLLFGILADRIGRARALVWSILTYSIFTAAMATAHSVPELILWRTLVGLGLGGEWSAGSVLVSETWPAAHRGKAIGFMQSGWAIGYILAAIFAALVLPQYGWRALFVIGIAPALLTVWIRRSVPEPEIWKAGRRDGQRDPAMGQGDRERYFPARQRDGKQRRPRAGRGEAQEPGALPADGTYETPIARHNGAQDQAWSRSDSGGDASDRLGPALALALAPTPAPLLAFVEMFRGPLLRRTIIATITTTFVLFGYWGLFTWIPTFLASPVEQGGAGLGLVRSSAWIVPMQIGAFFGYTTFGFGADRFGRRPMFIGFLVAAAILVPAYCLLGRSATALILLGPLVGFFGHGYFSVFGAMLAELFPTRIRATAQGLTYNAGRAVSALAPFTIGALADRAGLGPALATTSGFFLLGAASIMLLPETRGTDLAPGSDSSMSQPVSERETGA